MTHLRYLRYVMRHKWFVLLAAIRLGVPLWNALVHDWTKFLPSEWLPYSANFFGGPCSPEEKARRKAAFRRAWHHHLVHSPHHWQYWLLLSDSGALEPLQMPERFAREMVADWTGAGLAMGKPDIAGWYLDKRAGIQLHADTRRLVEEVLLPRPILSEAT